MKCLCGVTFSCSGLHSGSHCRCKVQQAWFILQQEHDWCKPGWRLILSPLEIPQQGCKSSENLTVQSSGCVSAPKPFGMEPGTACEQARVTQKARAVLTSSFILVLSFGFCLFFCWESSFPLTYTNFFPFRLKAWLRCVFFQGPPRIKIIRAVRLSFACSLLLTSHTLFIRTNICWTHTELLDLWGLRFLYLLGKSPGERWRNKGWSRLFFKENVKAVLNRRSKAAGGVHVSFCIFILHYFFPHPIK